MRRKQISNFFSKTRVKLESEILERKIYLNRVAMMEQTHSVLKDTL